MDCVQSPRKNKIDERLFINVLRGIAIFLMLWGHSIQYFSCGSFDFFENGVFKFIYSFHMPLFMLISGYLFYYSFSKRDLKSLLIHRTQSLLQPISMCGIFTFLCDGVILGLYHGEYKTILNGKWLGYLTYYWFLWSVLSSALAVGIACKASSKKWINAILLILGIPFVACFPCAEMNLYMYPYFVIGFLLCACKNLLSFRKIYPIRYAALVVFPVMLFFYKKEHYIYTSGLRGSEGLLRHMPVNMFRWMIGLAGCIFVIVILELLFKLAVYSGNIVVRFLDKLGIYSLQIYVLQKICLEIYLAKIYTKLVTLIETNVLTKNMVLYNFVWTFVIAVICSFGIMLLIRILEKMKINRLLFGK